MDFFKKRGTAWAFLAIVIVCSFFIGQARQPADKIEILPSGVYVQDNAGVLSASTEELMTELNNGLVSKVGAEIQVVTINTVGGQDIFDVAIDHGINTNLSENSCVFLIAVDDTDAAIVQGQALMNAFTDSDLTYILQQSFTVEDFDTRDLDAPAKTAFKNLIYMYEDYYGISVVASSNIEMNYSGDDMSSSALAMILLILLILIVILIITRPRRTVIRPVTTVGRTYVPPRTGSYTTRNSYDPPRTTGRSGSFGSSRSGGFGSSSRGGSFSSSSRSSSFGSSRSSFGGSSRSGGFGGGSRGGSFRSGGGSRGGSFRK